jgi:hypothetical protein
VKEMDMDQFRQADLIGRAITSVRGENVRVPEGALAAFPSHIEGRNALVTVWPDRIEWTRKRMLGRTDTNEIRMRSVTGVRTRKQGLRYTVVSIDSGSSRVEMRVTKEQAEALRTILNSRL